MVDVETPGTRRVALSPAHGLLRRACAMICCTALAVLAAFDGASAQRRVQPPRPAETSPAPAVQPTVPAPVPEVSSGASRETVQADVSTRSIAVNSGFSGTQLIIFGAVNNSQQPSAESAYYDIVIVVEGTPTRLVARKKSRMLGVWLNTTSITFESVPSYYTIISTHPLEEIADPLVLRENDIGFEYVRMTPIRGWETGVSTADLEDFKAEVIELKRRSGLYFESQLGVAFIGPSLFRASINLPGNVPVGQLVARVHLFRDGRLLHTFPARFNLRREGLERELYAFAFSYPLLYGIATVLLSVIGGFAATELFKRSVR
jgi:uncharacterized protein (TIGR02186 family)